MSKVSIPPSLENKIDGHRFELAKLWFGWTPEEKTRCPVTRGQAIAVAYNMLEHRAGLTPSAVYTPVEVEEEHNPPSLRSPVQLDISSAPNSSTELNLQADWANL